jgi:hypothetical protein
MQRMLQWHCVMAVYTQFTCMYLYMVAYEYCTRIYAAALLWSSIPALRLARRLSGTSVHTQRIYHYDIVTMCSTRVCQTYSSTIYTEL